MTPSEPPLILLVDDDDAFLGSMEKGLRREGFRVLTASSGAEALDLINGIEQRIDIVVMDIFLPDAWGSSLAFTLKQKQPDMRVVFVSGYAETDPILKDFRDPDVVLLSKPFDAGELAGELRRHLPTPASGYDADAEQER